MTVWHSEFVDSYRHMREHGNSASIFILVLTLSALLNAIVSETRISEFDQISCIGILLGVWAMSSVFVHLGGQHLERRFSKVDN